MKVFITFVLLLSTLSIQAQLTSNKIDVRIGLGFASDHDFKEANILQTELNYSMGNYLSVSTGVSIGDTQISEHQISYRQWNINLFLSPTKNSKRHHIRFGGGLSFMNDISIRVTDFDPSSVMAHPTIPSLFSATPIIPEVDSDVKKIAYNSIVEYTYRIKKRLLLSSSFQNQLIGDMPSRRIITLKLGFVI